MKLSDCVAANIDDCGVFGNHTYTGHGMQSPMVPDYYDNGGDFNYLPYAYQGTQEDVAGFQGYGYNYSAYEQPFHPHNYPQPVYADPTPTPPPQTTMDDLKNMLMEMQRSQDHLIAQLDQRSAQLATPQEPWQTDQPPSHPTSPHLDLHPAYSTQFYHNPQLQPIGYEVEDFIEEYELYRAEDAVADEPEVQFYKPHILMMSLQSVEPTTDHSGDSYDVYEDVVGEQLEPELYCDKEAIGVVNPEAEIEEVNQKLIPLGPTPPVWPLSPPVDRLPATFSEYVGQKVEDKVEGLAMSLNFVVSDALMRLGSCAGEFLPIDITSRFEDLKEPAKNEQLDSIEGWVFGHSAQDFKAAPHKLARSLFLLLYAYTLTCSYICIHVAYSKAFDLLLRALSCFDLRCFEWSG